MKVKVLVVRKELRSASCYIHFEPFVLHQLVTNLLSDQCCTKDMVFINKVSTTMSYVCVLFLFFSYLQLQFLNSSSVFQWFRPFNNNNNKKTVTNLSDMKSPYAKMIRLQLPTLLKGDHYFLQKRGHKKVISEKKKLSLEPC